MRYVLAGVIVAWLAFLGGADARRTSTQNGLNLLSIGDSQTAERFSINSQGAQLFQTYPYLIASRKGYGNVWNAGISGNTSTQMLARFGADVLAHRPGAVSIMAGPNDMTTNISGGVWVGGGISVATTKSNIKTMVQNAQAQRARVTLVSFFPVRETAYLANAGAYLTAFQEIANETGCEYVDLYSSVNALSSGQQDSLYITGDTNHPNAAGHKYLSDMVSGNQFGQY